MKFMMPITKKSDIAAIADYLKQKNERDYVLFMSALHLGRRISDILQYRVADLKNQEYLEVKEGKTGKTVHLKINKQLQSIYKPYFANRQGYEYAFRRNNAKVNLPISRQRTWQIFKEAAQAVGYPGSIGCHTLRKTFAYWIYQNNHHDLALVQSLLGHADPSITLHYLGINRQTQEAAMDGLIF